MQLQLKLLNSFCFAFYLNLDILRGVANPSLEVVFSGQAIDERPEAHALDDATDANTS